MHMSIYPKTMQHACKMDKEQAHTLMEWMRSSRAICEVRVRRFLVTVSNSAARLGLVLSTSAGKVGNGNSPVRIQQMV